MKDATAAADTAYGSLIAPNLVAPNHDHFFNFRLDFDVDGTANSFMRTALLPATFPEGTPRRSLWVTKDEMPKTELEGRYRVDPMKPAMYHVANEGKESGLGHHPGYMILPESTVAYSPLDVLNDPPAKRNGYIDYTIWNTAYAAGERYAGGEYAFQSDGQTRCRLGCRKTATSIHRHRDLVHDGHPPRPAHGRLARDVDDVAGHHPDAVQLLLAQPGTESGRPAVLRAPDRDPLAGGSDALAC